jgi:hypothetical protein
MLGAILWKESFLDGQLDSEPDFQANGGSAEKVRIPIQLISLQRKEYNL